MKKFLLSLALMLCASPVYAQGGAAAPVTGVGTTRGIWEMYANYISKSAEMLPESDYTFKPTPAVRSFGQLLGHVAGSQYMFCAAALGDKPRAEDDIEKTVTSKEGLIKALKESADYCRKAYALSDADATGSTSLFGGPQSKMFALVLNAAHVGEHYGNIVTYLRIKGMVPPSSQPRQ